MKRLTLKALCEQCTGETNHQMVAEHMASTDASDNYWWRAKYQILRCCGCDSVSFREEIATEDDYDPNTGRVQSTVKLYPPRVTGRKPLVQDYHLPDTIYRT